MTRPRVWNVPSVAPKSPRSADLVSQLSTPADAVPPMFLTELAELPERGRVVLTGYVDAITIQPMSAAPAFTAIVSDHPAPAGGRRRPAAQLRLIWLGQRRVPGVFAGSRLRCEGMVAMVDGLATIHNPRYEILPEPDAAGTAGARTEGRTVQP